MASLPSDSRGLATNAGVTTRHRIDPARDAAAAAASPRLRCCFAGVVVVVGAADVTSALCAHLSKRTVRVAAFGDDGGIARFEDVGRHRRCRFKWLWGVGCCGWRWWEHVVDAVMSVLRGRERGAIEPFASALARGRWRRDRGDGDATNARRGEW